MFRCCRSFAARGDAVTDGSSRLGPPLSKSLQTLEVKYGSDQTAGGVEGALTRPQLHKKRHWPSLMVPTTAW